MRSKDIIATAMRWVGRDQGYPALCREIAWIAARATETDRDDLEWLVSLVDRQLAERIDQLPLVVHRASVDAAREHRSSRPHDDEGADLVADLAGRDAAVEYLSTAYMDALDWAIGVLHDRRTSKAERSRRWQRLRRRKAVDAPVECEVARRILDGLTWRSTQPGWPDRRAA
jgi:hypothetical protein